MSWQCARSTFKGCLSEEIWKKGDGVLDKKERKKTAPRPACLRRLSPGSKKEKERDGNEK